MYRLRWDRLWEFLSGTEFRLGLLWTGLSALAVALGILVYSRWGRSRAIEKCLVLSALLHVWAMVFSTSLKLVVAPSPNRGDSEIRVVLGDSPIGDADTADRRVTPVQEPMEDRQWTAPPLPTPTLDRRSPKEQPAVRPEPVQAESRPPNDRPQPAPVPQLAEAPAETVPQPTFAVGPDSPRASLSPVIPTSAPPGDPPRPTAAEPVTPVGMVGFDTPRSKWAPPDYQVPKLYQSRTDPNRAELARRSGADPRQEEAVKAALTWLTRAQEPDGRWTSLRHGGGQETLEAGRDRQGAGSQADTAITGLAILAFMASGQTHLEGENQETVRRGLEFLLQSQGADGSLGGRATLYEFMYCHGIATLALSESLGMTGDSRLRQPVVNAVAYTLAAQDPSGGGWRYRPHEAGDTSQLGWQLMALKSAETAGIRVPQAAWEGASRFLDSVAAGNPRGLASYRPGERPSRTMTAEALACRLFMGLRPDQPEAREAGDYLLREAPGEGQANLYYWYYGTMAMYQLQGTHWKRWDDGIRKTLLSSQRSAGPLAGSWDPNTRWDGYGGRVYSTALATLCLEAYYRFCPLHASPSEVADPAR